jgi:FlaA1/EpsC-like NDP-sugar epimerase
VGFVFVRVLRQILRDLFFLVDVGKMNETKKAKRVLVYGSGLKYRAFSRELVRSFAHNTRYIVGIIDDDVYIKSLYIGSVKVLGAFEDIPRLIEEKKIDAIVIACNLPDQKMQALKEMLSGRNVELTMFSFNEVNILNNKTENKEG